MTAVSIEEKLSRITEHWRPKLVAELNGQEVELVEFQGEFSWHHHANEDEMFLGWPGRMSVEFRDRIVPQKPAARRSPALPGIDRAPDFEAHGERALRYTIHLRWQ